MIYLPIFGAISHAVGSVLEKAALSKEKINPKNYQTLSFMSIVILMLPLLYFFWRVSIEAFSFRNIFIMILVIAFSLLANFFTFYSLKWEKITKLEPARIMEPLFVILLAILFSFFFDSGMYEKNMSVVIPALIAGLTLILTHIKKHHLEFGKYFVAAILGSFFFALEMVVSRLILDFYSPMSFYFVRCLFIFVFSLVIFRPELKGLEKKNYGMIILIGFVWLIYRVIVYYGYIHYGIIFTTLIIMLGPVFLYFLAIYFLGEKFRIKNVISSIIILICVLYGTLY